MQRIPPVDPFASFKTFGDPTLRDAVDAAMMFMSSTKPLWLSLIGKSGTGKTFLGTLVYNAMLASRPKLRQHETLISGTRIDFWPELVTAIREQEFWRVGAIADANLAFIDEIVVEHDPSGLVKDKLAEVLTRRVGKWTILTSNLSIERLGEIDHRIPSRMIRDGNIVVQMDCVDYALRKHKAVLARDDQGGQS